MRRSYTDYALVWVERADISVRFYSTGKRKKDDRNGVKVIASFKTIWK